METPGIFQINIHVVELFQIIQSSLLSIFYFNFSMYSVKCGGKIFESKSVFSLPLNFTLKRMKEKIYEISL
jgi:hypothetical protein